MHSPARHWKIPIGWKRNCRLDDVDDGYSTALTCDYEEFQNERSRPLLIGGREDFFLQVFGIDENGTSTVEKFGYRLSRSRWSFTGSVAPIE